MSAAPVSLLYACQTDGTITPLRIAHDGTCVPIPGGTIRVVPPSGNPEQTPSSWVGMVIHPHKRYAYAINIDDRLSMIARTTLHGFRIAPDGRLRPLQQTLTIKDYVGDILIEPRGDFLYLSGSDAVWSYGIRANGELRPLSQSACIGSFTKSDGYEARQSSREWEQHETSVAFFPSGKSALVHNYNAWRSGDHYNTSQYQLLPNGEWRGTPSLLDNTNRGGEYYGDVFTAPKGNFLFRNAHTATSQYGDGQVEFYRIQPGDKLVRIDQSQIPARLKQIQAIDPLGRFVFGATKDTIDTYRINADGSLPLIATTPSVAFDYLLVEDTGHFLYAAEAIYAIAPSGQLQRTGKAFTRPTNTLSLQSVALP